MFILVTYDVNITSDGGKRRLRKIAKECENYGIRVQNSVFECEISNAKWVEVKDKLLKIIDIDLDSLRFYYIGDKNNKKIEHYGNKEVIDVSEPLVI